MSDIRALLDMTAEADRRSLLAMPQQEMFAELAARRKAWNAEVDKEMRNIRKLHIRRDEEWQAECMMRALGLEGRA